VSLVALVTLAPGRSLFASYTATTLTNGATRWTRATAVTRPTTDPSSLIQQKYDVDPAFQAYYQAHAGNALLGNALTLAFPTASGWVQFFECGALLDPDQREQAGQAGTSPSDTTLDNLVAEGVRDPATGIIRIPLLHALLSVGSLAPIDGTSDNLTYVSLRNAMQPQHLVAAPETNHPTSTGIQPIAKGIFVPGGKHGSEVLGHVIPQALWNALQEPAIAPDGWRTDYGDPLTEALPVTKQVSDEVHHFLVQVFAHGALMLDMSAPPGSSEPPVSGITTGLAYLSTVGMPTPEPSSQTHTWATGDTALTAAPGGKAIAHIGQNYPLTSTGNSQWVHNALWYEVTWSGGHDRHTGWVPASAITFSSPGNQPAWASFDALSPSLASFLTQQGANTGAVVFDVTRNRYYTYNPDRQFTMASSAKVPIMLAFMRMLEQQGRGPNANEMYLLTTMIENSDNDSAQALFDEIGGAGPMSDLMNVAKIPGLRPDPDAWGWSTISPLAMVRLLTQLQSGHIVSDQNRTLAFRLMENIEPDQRVGVGDTAPSGATVAMKDGWVPAPDGLWAMNSSGIVTVGSETYIIAVYSQEQQSLDSGWAITRRVAGDVAKLLP
jgi:beta-lactamase class A